MEKQEPATTLCGLRGWRPEWIQRFARKEVRHYAKRVFTQQKVDVKLGPRRNYHEGRAALRHYANQPVPYGNCVGVSISHLLTVGSTPV